MALRVEKYNIVGEIDNLQDKLDGKLPIDRLELIYLVNSWGRDREFSLKVNDEYINLKKSEPKECYDLSKLDTSLIKDFSKVFESSLFKGNIDNWNTSNVTNMKDMLLFSSANVGNIGKWNVSNVTNLDNTFSYSNFNSNIANWDVSNVTSMNGTFKHATEFNSPLYWNTSKVTNMESMFEKTTSFNQPLELDTKNVTNIRYMFSQAKEFNQPLNFETSKVTDLDYFLAGASKFNQELNFNTSNVTSMTSMLSNAKSFNKDLNFDTNKVTSFHGFLNGVPDYNSNLNFTNVSLANSYNKMKNFFDEKYDSIINANFFDLRLTKDYEIASTHKHHNSDYMTELFHKKFPYNKDFVPNVKEPTFTENLINYFSKDEDNVDKKIEESKKLISEANKEIEKLKFNLEELNKNKENLETIKSFEESKRQKSLDM